MHYYERLKAMRIDSDISQAEIAEILGTTRQQIYKYENGINEMTVSKLITLCQYYRVSSDYILGLPRSFIWPRK